MEKMLIVNGSPRAPRSNSKRYIEWFKMFWPSECLEYLVTDKKHKEVCQKIDEYQHLLLVFPLYADGLPVTLMHFLNELKCHRFKRDQADAGDNGGYASGSNRDSGRMQAPAGGLKGICT